MPSLQNERRHPPTLSPVFALTGQARTGYAPGAGLFLCALVAASGAARQLPSCAKTYWNRAGTERCYARLMPTPTPPTLERVLQGLHDSEIRCGIQNEPPAGGITAWIDFGSRTEKATFYGTIVGDQQIWPAADRIAA
jgi:hypothetical protein